MDREQVLGLNPILTFLQNRGAVLKRSGKTFVTNSCPRVGHHQAHHLCVSVDQDQGTFHCNDNCNVGGSVIDWVMIEKNMDFKQACEELGGTDVQTSDQGRSQPKNKADSIPHVPGQGITKTQLNKKPHQQLGEPDVVYEYTDENNRVLYEVLRYGHGEGKTFRQRQKLQDGSHQWDLDGVTRVLYRLPQVLAASTVIVVEGEKSSDYLDDLGVTATTNCGGSNGWLEAYAYPLQGKDIVVIPDNDPAGNKRADAVIESLVNKANSIKRVMAPEGFKDIDQWLDAIPSDQRLKSLNALIDTTAHVLPPVPIYNMKEMEDRYREFVKKQGEAGYSLQRFHPGFAKITRKMVPGEVLLIIGDTGSCKTAVAQTIAKSAAPLPTLFFEMELPETMMFERFVQMELGVEGQTVEWEYAHSSESRYQDLKGLHHILVCPQAGLTVQNVEHYITRSALKFGKMPAIVIVDYIGLMRKANAKSRYEVVSDCAEDLKVIAKRCNVVMIILSQVARHFENKNARTEIRLHDGKDSSSLEASAGLVVGVWQSDENELTLKILKNTKGKAGHTVTANVDWKSLTIS